MRSITNVAKVEGHNSLVRDMSSNAIISTNDSEFQSYQKRREAEKKRQQMLDQQAQEIENIKNDMSEIKQMLRLLVSNKG